MLLFITFIIVPSPPRGARAIGVVLAAPALFPSWSKPFVGTLPGFSQLGLTPTPLPLSSPECCSCLRGRSSDLSPFLRALHVLSGNVHLTIAVIPVCSVCAYVCCVQRCLCVCVDV